MQPIALAHVLDSHLGTRLRGMNEFALPNVDAYMAELSARGVVERQV